MARVPEVAAVTPPMSGARPDTLALASEVMPSSVEYGWHDLESRDTALDLLRIEDLAHADAYRAAIIPGPGGPRDTRGYIIFTQLNLYGTGSGPTRCSGSLHAGPYRDSRPGPSCQS